MSTSKSKTKPVAPLNKDEEEEFKKLQETKYWEFALLLSSKITSKSLKNLTEIFNFLCIFRKSPKKY